MDKTQVLRRIRSKMKDLRDQVAIEVVQDIDLALLAEDVKECTKCALHQQCKQRVPGIGPTPSDIMFVGESSGENEDEQGIPFVGNSGQMLDKIVEAIGWKREDIYITNVIKCRPPENRNPHAEEVAACYGHLKKEIKAVKPKVIVCWGSVAANVLIHPDFKITQEMGHWFEHDGIRYIAAFHPSYILRLGEGTQAQNTAKWQVWEAIQKVKQWQDQGYSDPITQR